MNRVSRGAALPKVVDLHSPRRTAAPVSGTASGRQLRYEAVIELIESLVVEQSLQPGDLLPTQRELAELADVSSITVRRALEELERAGRVRRHQGVGTFLAGPRIISEPGLSGTLLGTLTAQHRKPRIASRMVTIERSVPAANLTDALALEPGEQVWQVRRQRLVDGRPAVLETAAIPVRLAPRLDHFKAQLRNSLYDLLESQFGLADDHEEQYLEVGGATAAELHDLNLVGKSQVVRIRGLSATADGVPFDCFEQVYPAAEFVFYISGGVEKRLLSLPTGAGWEMTAPTRLRARAQQAARPAQLGKLK